MKSNEKDFRFLDVLTLSFSHFAHDVYTSFLSPLLPLLMDKLNLSYSKAGLLNVIRGLPSLLNPFIGMLIDKKGGKWFIILGPTITAVFMSILGLAESYAVLIILLLFVGINSTFFHVPVPVMVKKFSGNKSGMGMSFFMVGGELSRSVGPIIVLYAVGLWTLEGIWRLIPFGALASILIFFRLQTIEYPKLSKKTKQEKIWLSLKKIGLFFIYMFWFMFFVWLMKISLTYFLPVYLKAKGNSLWFAGSALAVIQFSGMFGAMFGGYLSDKIGRSKILIFVWIVAPLIMRLFVNTENPNIAIAILILLGLLIYVTTPVMLAYVHDINCKRPSFINSMFMITNFGANAFATMLIGFFSDKFGIMQTIKFASLTGFITIPFIFMLKKEFKKLESFND